MRAARLASLMTLVAVGCGASGRRNPNGGGGNGGGGFGGGSMDIPGCDKNSVPRDGDFDMDGYTPNQGDCDDCNPSINPGAIQIPGDPTDYACNGMPGVVASCDSGNTGKNDATSLAQAFEQCDSRFFKSAMLVGPSDQRARIVAGSFGIVKPQNGANMALLSTGLAVDKTTMPGYEPEMGFDLGNNNTFMNPMPSIPANPLCASSAQGGMSCQPPTVNDYTELVVNLKAPTNVKSFSFNFHFFSVEYPEWVCTAYNDEFLVMMESPGEFTTATNISFDSNMNPITVNNGLFTVCKNGNQSWDKNCKQPVSTIVGTGYDDPESQQQLPNDNIQNAPASCMAATPADMVGPSDPLGGSTGWLTTTAPVTPGEEVTLHFIIFDEGDHVYDSAVLIDNFQWGTSVVMSPTTNPIQ
jgi:hypothetical protein